MGHAKGVYLAALVVSPLACYARHFYPTPKLLFKAVVGSAPGGVL